MNDQLLWQYLETLPTQSNPWCDWNYALGQWSVFPEFQKRYLILNKGKAMAVNCKSNCGINCPRKVVEHAPDDIVAVCPEQEEKSYPLNCQDILVYSLKRNALHKDLCAALGIAHRESKETDCRHTWRIGEYTPDAKSRFPTFITFQQEPNEFTEVILNLCTNYDKPFTVITPTRQLLTPRVEQLLEKRKSLFLAMSEEVTFSDNGILQVKRPVEEIFARFQTRETASVPASSVKEITPDNYFRKRGGFWAVRFCGNQEILLHGVNKGSEYLNLLLSRPNQETSVYDIVCGFAIDLCNNVLNTEITDTNNSFRITNGSPLGDAGFVADRKAVKEYKETAQDLFRKIDVARADNNTEEVNALEEEMIIITGAIQEATGLGGRLRKDKDDRKRIRDAFGNAIRRAIKYIDKYDKPLAKHLKETIKCGNRPVYRPEIDILWEVQPVINK